jgi:hypothetical protein
MLYIWKIYKLHWQWDFKQWNVWDRKIYNLHEQWDFQQWNVWDRKINNLHEQWDYKQWNVWDCKCITYMDSEILSNGMYEIWNA